MDLTGEQVIDAKRIRASGRKGRMDPVKIANIMSEQVGHRISVDAIRRALGLPITRTQGYRYQNNNPVSHLLGKGRSDPPAFVLAERDRRYILEHRTTTAAFCGDPLPGESALDKLRSPWSRNV
jgi:hypothetical protein